MKACTRWSGQSWISNDAVLDRDKPNVHNMQKRRQPKQRPGAGQFFSRGWTIAYIMCVSSFVTLFAILQYWRCYCSSQLGADIDRHKVEQLVVLHCLVFSFVLCAFTTSIIGLALLLVLQCISSFWRIGSGRETAYNTFAAGVTFNAYLHFEEVGSGRETAYCKILYYCTIRTTLHYR